MTNREPAHILMVDIACEYNMPEFADIEEMILKSLDEAEKRGAEKMRERAAQAMRKSHGHDGVSFCQGCEHIRALPVEE